MAEGPTARFYAVKIYNEFRGETVKEVFIKSKKIFYPIDALIGRKITESTSLGKNILLFFDDVAIRIHLMMYGSIHIYGVEEPLSKPAERIRMMISGMRKKLVVYNAPIVEVDEGSAIVGRLKNSLGPDPLGGDWDAEKAMENVLKFTNERIGVVLLNQSVIAGIGNILRNEILFRAGIHPERVIADLSPEELKKIINLAERLSKEFLELKLKGDDLRKMLLVYGRSGKLCRNCANPIRLYVQKPINRKTFVCENCQK